MGIEFILFALIGIVLFVPLQGNARTICMVVYVVLMVLWLLGFAFAIPLHLTR